MGGLNRTVIEMLQGVAYIRGVLEQNVSEDSNPVKACTEIERRLWELLEEEDQGTERAPEAKTGERQEPRPLQVDCMNLEPVEDVTAVEAVTEPGQVWTKDGDVTASEQKPEGEPKQDDIPKPAEVPPAESVQAMHRKECLKCQYYSGHTNTCDYSGRTGKIRGIAVAECEYWKDGKKQKPRVYRHICKSCGKEFRDGAARTRFCPKCREEMEK